MARQQVLDRLTGQHLAVTCHANGRAIAAASIRGDANAELRAEAAQRAVAQEAELFEVASTSKVAYLNAAARVQAPISAAHQSAEPAEHQAAACSTEVGLDDRADEAHDFDPQSGRGRKRRRVESSATALVDAPIDWSEKGSSELPQPQIIGTNSTCAALHQPNSKVPNLGGSGAAKPPAKPPEQTKIIKRKNTVDSAKSSLLSWQALQVSQQPAAGAYHQEMLDGKWCLGLGLNASLPSGINLIVW